MFNLKCCYLFQILTSQHIRGQDAIGLETYQMQMLMTDILQRTGCLTIGMYHQFSTIETRGVRIVIVMVEQRMAPIGL